MLLFCWDILFRLCVLKIQDTFFSSLFHTEMTFNLRSFPPVFPLCITSRLCWISEFPFFGTSSPFHPNFLKIWRKKNYLYMETVFYTCSSHLIINKTYVGITELCGSLRDQSTTAWTTQLSSDAFVIYFICSLLCYCLLQQWNPGL